MARRRYYRRSVRVVPAKKKWASNITQITLRQGRPNVGGGPIGNFHPLVSNSAGNSTPTPVIIKTGNFKVQVDAVSSLNLTTVSSVNVIVFIAFLPEGYSYSATDPDSGATLMKQHPEWIMAWKQIDFTSSTGQATNNSATANFSSRLKRNLNSGDKIIFGTAYPAAEAKPEPANDGNYFSYTVACQYWTCAN